MIFGNLLDIWGDSDAPIFESATNNTEYKKPSKFSSILSALSRYGMNYDEDIYKNMQAIPGDKMLQNTDPYLGSSLYGNYNSNWKVKSEEERPFREKTLDQKREMLRKIALQPEIEDILDMMANECIVYDDEESYICTPFLDNAVIQDLNEQSLSEIRSAVNSIFYKMYLLLGWKNDAWNQFKRYLIDGVLAFEIVYDNIEHPHNIIGIVALDPATLTKQIANGVTTWIQFKGEQNRERTLLDAQVIYIKYEDSGAVDRQSYLQRLIRPFNVYRIVEEAQIVWTVTQSSFKLMFKIPLNGMNRKNGMQTLTAAMNRYKEDINFNSETGELKVNGKTNLPFNKEFWMPENEAGTPEIETLADGGPSINDSEQLNYFENKLYRMSKIPSSRFDKENQATWFGTDAASQLRDEINFSRFVTRIRSIFAFLLLKPLRIQLALQIPDIKNDKRILDSISLRFNSYNQFTELMEQEIDMKRMEYIQTLKETFMSTDEDGNEESYFCDKFLLIKYMKMSDADLELNEKYKLEEKLKKKLTPPEDENSDVDDDEEETTPEDNSEEESSDNGEGSGDEENASGQKIDKEMLGNVQPEGPETTEA